jgi:hypothetical protein
VAWEAGLSGSDFHDECLKRLRFGGNSFNLVVEIGLSSVEVVSISGRLGIGFYIIFFANK